MKFVTKRFATTRRIVASLLLAIMTSASGSAYAANCLPDNCVGPCNYEELLVDTRFSYDCPNWVKSNSKIHRVRVGTNWLMELSGIASLSQTVSTGSYVSMDMAFDVHIIKTNPGTERLYVEIMRGSTVLETVAVIYPQSTQTLYSMYIENYSNDSIKIRFRYAGGAAPGDTVYRVDNATMFGYFY